MPGWVAAVVRVIGGLEFEDDLEWVTAMMQERGSWSCVPLNYIEAPGAVCHLTNHLTIMNTCFQKKQCCLTTWKHPAAKETHMIDYTIIRTMHRRFCSDEEVMRGANCWSDHCMVRMKIKIQLPSRRKTPAVMAISARNHGEVQAWQKACR